jgi:hypothetical protein
MSLTTLENTSRAQECPPPAPGGRAEDRGARVQRDNDFLAARAAAHVTIEILDRLLDDPTNPDALAATCQHLADNPHWTHRARLFIAAQPD